MSPVERELREMRREAMGRRAAAILRDRVPAESGRDEETALRREVLSEGRQRCGGGSRILRKRLRD